MAIDDYYLEHLDTPVFGVSASVFLLPPSTGEDVTVKYAIDTLIDESLQGIEYRKADYKRLRSSIGWNSVMTVESLWEFHDFIITLGGRSVIIPIWPDVCLYADYDLNKIHESDFIIGWDTGYSNVEIRTDGILPNTEYVCTAVMGYLESPSIDYYSEKTAKVNWGFIEDSPYNAGFTIAQSDKFEWAFDKNWRENPTSLFDDNVFFSQIGNEREVLKDGYEDVKVQYTRLVTLEDDDIIRFLSFYESKQGPVMSWEIIDTDLPPVETDWNDGSPLESVDVGSKLAFTELVRGMYSTSQDEVAVGSLITFAESVTLQYYSVEGEEVSMGSDIVFSDYEGAKYIDDTEEVSVGSDISLTDYKSSEYTEHQEEVSVGSVLTFEEYIL